MITAQLGNNIQLLMFAVIAVILVVVLIRLGRYISLWLRSLLTGAGISFMALLLMSLRKVDPKIILDAKVMAVQAGLHPISTAAMEMHYLAGGDVRNVVRALVAAHRAGLEFGWDSATTIDLTGQNVLELVQTRVNSEVIDTRRGAPHPG